MITNYLSDSVDSLDSKDIVAASSFPVHDEIYLPSNEINVEPSESGVSVTSVVKTKTASKVGDDYPRYAQIAIDVEPSKHVVVTEQPQSPTSIYALGGSLKHPKLALKSREVSTRQCKFDMAEEWEQFQIKGKTSMSCPPSPLNGRHDVGVGHDNVAYAASEPGAEIDQDITDSADKTKDPFPFHYLFTSETSGIKEYHIVPNPYNNVNQRFHSTLQCPCFLFFFFLCCLPAVHFMQQSERQYKKGNRQRASNYGKLSTVMYVLGSVVGVTFLAVSIYFAADYVRQFL